METIDPRTILFSVDLEPNKDGTLTGIAGAMEWFDETIQKGTVFTTYDIAKNLPDLLKQLSESHEIGVHVHPQEFGYDHDELASLSRDKQRALIKKTRSAISDATDQKGNSIDSFRAGRHCASLDTLNILDEMGFTVDASINPNYTSHLPGKYTKYTEPFRYKGIIEVPTSSCECSLFSLCGIRGTVTATANTLRNDRLWCSGRRAVKSILDSVDTFSFYMHPYDATAYHALSGSGSSFRSRVEELTRNLSGGCKYMTMSEYASGSNIV